MGESNSWLSNGIIINLSQIENLPCTQPHKMLAEKPHSAFSLSDVLDFCPDCGCD
jgi:hypothetical protein